MANEPPKGHRAQISIRLQAISLPLKGGGRRALARRVGVAVMFEKQSRFTRTPAMTARARTLRRRMSPIEQKLWHALRGAQLGASFRRQHPVGPYVLDFYCATAGLAVELDGDEHASRTERDSLRTRFLNRRGIGVIRFSNRDVWSNLRGVKESIAFELGRIGA